MSSISCTIEAGLCHLVLPHNLEENFLKRLETAAVDELDGGVRNKCVWAWLGFQDANEDSLQVSITDLRGYFLKQLLIFYSLTISSPDEEREVDLGTFVDDESDVELDLDLDLEHNDDDLESDRVYSPIQWIELGLQRNLSGHLTLPEQVLSLRILIYYTPPHQ